MIYIFLITLVYCVTLASVVYLYYRHTRELQILLKANTLGEAQAYDKPVKETEIKDEPTLTEIIEPLQPDQIRSLFKKDFQQASNQTAQIDGDQ